MHVRSETLVLVGRMHDAIKTIYVVRYEYGKASISRQRFNTTTPSMYSVEVVIWFLPWTISSGVACYPEMPALKSDKFEIS